MRQLEISLLGGLNIQFNSEPLAGLRSDKVRALLIYLAAESDRAHSRIWLANLLWPTWTESEGRSHLRNALANLRTALDDKQVEEPFLLVTRQTLQFNRQSHFRLDIEPIDQLLDQDLTVTQLGPGKLQSLESAIASYQGEFLKGFHLNECIEFDAWVRFRRRRLELSLVAGLRALANYNDSQNAFAKAEQYINHLLQIDPLDETSHRRQMKLLARQGKRSAALAEFNRYCKLIAEELSAEPEPETIILHRRIQAGEFGNSTSNFSGNAAQEQSIELATSTNANSEIQGRLPASTTSFVGRKQEIQEIVALLSDSNVRLVTLTGPGGVGKTRLSLAVGNACHEERFEQVVFIELASLQNPNLILPEIGRAVGVPESMGRSRIEAIRAVVNGASLLLLLDNYEHLIESSHIIAELLAAISSLTCLVTSREPLMLYGEHEFTVDPLPLPLVGPKNIEAEKAQSKFIHSDAVELFLQRIPYSRRGQLADTEKLQTIAEICIRLDGIPLAIELAAAKLRYGSPESLLNLLGQNEAIYLSGLRSRRRDIAHRHQTLQNTIDWSYRLLTSDEQKVFRLLSVFRGGFTIDAVESLCDSTMLDNDEGVMTLLHSLIDKSLARVYEEEQEQSRFELLETIRAYGIGKLKSNNEWDAFCHSHALHYLKYVEYVGPQLKGPEQTKWINALDKEYPNIRTALEWFISQSEAEMALRMTASLRFFWQRRIPGSEVLEWLDRVFDLPDTDKVRTPAYAQSLFEHAYSNNAEHLEIRYASFLEASNVFEEVNDLSLHVVSLDLAALCLYHLGRYNEYEQVKNKQERHQQKLNDSWVSAMNLVNYGEQIATLGQIERGHSICLEGVALFENINERWGNAIALTCLGKIQRLQGRFEDAQESFERAIRLGKEIDDTELVASVECSLGGLFIETEQLELAAAMLPIALKERFYKAGKLHCLETVDDLVYLFEKRFFGNFRDCKKYNKSCSVNSTNSPN